ncbi:MAG: P1 family peptidase [Proteobacteria bacterium]|nr:P1 family peptidase [Pseudomonadota bacterium]MCP4918719.1 P1 family peptidase [Pseudomonadota bacterium]
MNRTITGVPGVLAGHWTHDSGTTGCTAFLFPQGAVGGAVVPGSAPGSRELGVLEAEHLADRIHGFCLSGGSAFGLSTADGVMKNLVERGIGFPIGPHIVPLVPTAILFDLSVAEARPDASSGEAAAAGASDGPLPEGRVGAGAGATAGLASNQARRAGLGSWLEQDDLGVVGAAVALNAYGSVKDPQTGEWLAGTGEVRVEVPLLTNTTLAVVATSAPLTKAQCNVVARMASAGFARCIYPAYAPVDGDTVLVASTGTGSPLSPIQLARVGHLAAVSIERSIVRALA